LALTSGKMEIKEIRGLYLKALDKVEELNLIGGKQCLSKSPDFSKLRTEIQKIENSLDLMAFKASGYLAQLTELMRTCGLICCKKVVKPGSFEMIFKCAVCPIFLFEETFLKPVEGDDKIVELSR
jgi:hypothetical protein